MNWYKKGQIEEQETIEDDAVPLIETENKPVYNNQKIKEETKKLVGKVNIREIDPEDDWEAASVVEKIANTVGIRFDRAKDVSIIAEVGDEVVGGVADSISNDSDEGFVYDFDVVVDPKWQGPQMVGFKLIDAAIQRARGYECHIIKTHVVNTRLLPILVSRYGFEGWDEFRPTPSAILHKYI